MKYACVILLLLCAACVAPADELIPGKARGHTNALTPRRFDFSARLPAGMETSAVMWISDRRYNDDTNDWSLARATNNLVQGTAAAMPTWTTSGRYYDGTNDYTYTDGITGTNALNQLTNVATFAAWIRFQKTGVGAAIAQKGDWLGTSQNAWLFLITTANKLCFGLDDTTSNVTHNVALHTNEWYHVVAMFDYANKWAAIYTNGVMGTSNSLGGAIPDSAIRNVFLGVIWSSTGAEQLWFQGNITEPLLFDRTLNASEAAWLFNARKAAHGY